MLPFALFRIKRIVLVFLDDGNVRFAHNRERILGESKELIFGPVVEIIEEYAAKSTSFSPVLDIKVLVAPFLEPRVERRVVGIAH